MLSSEDPRSSPPRMHGPTTQVHSCNPSVARVHDRQANRFGGPLPGETNVHCGQYKDDDWYNEVMGKVVELDANELEVIALATPKAVHAKRRCAW